MKINLPIIRPLLTSGAVLLLAAACSSGTLTSAWTFVPPQPTGSPGPSGATATPCPSGGASESPAASAGAPSTAPVASAAASPAASVAVGSPAPSTAGLQVGSLAAASPAASAAAPSAPPATIAPASALPSVAPSPAASPTTSAGAATPAASTSATAAPSVAATPAASAAPESPGASATSGQCGVTGTLIALEETANVTITKDGQPVSALDVKKGDTITFQITNSAGFDHDFYIGTADQLQNNQTGGLQGIAPFSSGVQQLTYTVTDATATLQFACTLPGHYATMHGTFNVQP